MFTRFLPTKRHAILKTDVNRMTTVLCTSFTFKFEFALELLVNLLLVKLGIGALKIKIFLEFHVSISSHGVTASATMPSTTTTTLTGWPNMSSSYMTKNSELSYTSYCTISQLEDGMKESGIKADYFRNSHNTRVKQLSHQPCLHFTGNSIHTALLT